MNRTPAVMMDGECSHLCTNHGGVWVRVRDYWRSDFTLKMASAQVVKTSVTNNSPSQDSNHPDILFQSRYVKWYMKCFIHWTADLKSSKLWSSQYFIYHFTPILHGLIRTHKWAAPNVSGFIAQLVRASHRYREVTGPNPVEVLTFSGFYAQLLKLRS